MAVTGLGLAFALGCASTTERAGLAEEGPAVAPTAQVEPVIIQSMELRELAPGAELAILGDARLVWTQYRDPDENLIVELPNTLPVPGLGDLQMPTGLVASVLVETEEEEGERPLTRLTIRTREEAEHSLVNEDNLLSLRLRPVSVEPAPVVSELQEEPRPVDVAAQEEMPELEVLEEMEPQAELQEPAPPVLGTPEQPYVSGPPEGVPATQLEGVEIVAANDVTLIRVRGDGGFLFRSFYLESPERFVIDLPGVINNSLDSLIEVDSRLVNRVRMAQFKPYPEPISRVVFDLKQLVPPVVEETGDGLSIRFEEGQQVALLEPRPQPVTLEPEPMPGAAGQEEPMAVAQDEPMIREVAEPIATPEMMDQESPQVAETVGEQEPSLPEPSPVIPTMTDVELVEAQELEMEEPSETEEPTVPTFGAQNIEGERQYFGDPISMSLKDADITEVLRSIAKISDLNIVIQPGVRGPVTVELDRVPWDQALDQILKVHNLGMQLDGNILRIAPIARLRAEAEEQQRLEAAKALSVPLQTIMKRISYAQAADIARILTTGSGTGAGVMSQRGSVTVDPRTNTLIIKELPGFLQTVISVIETLDVPEPQVMIEARIIETTKNFSRSLGIAWGFDGVASPLFGNSTGLEFPNNINADGTVQLLSGGNNGMLDINLGNVLNTFELDLQLIAAENEGLVNVISAPKVATLNNRRASIQTGLQIPIQTVANNTVTVQFVNATLRLDVTPHVTAEGTVLMDINIQKREPQLAFAVVGASNAPIATREATTRVIVRDGGTTVIGGIYEITTNQGQDRVPGLANIPILGHLFKNKSKDNTNEELLIFITPRVIQL